MDSGSVAFDPDTEAEFDFAATSSPEEILWLMDELSCREVGYRPTPFHCDSVSHVL